MDLDIFLKELNTPPKCRWNTSGTDSASAPHCAKSVSAKSIAVHSSNEDGSVRKYKRANIKRETQVNSPVSLCR